MQATAIVLAGGKSSRMGTNKALLQIDGKTVIERIVEELKEVVDDFIIVTNSFHEYEFLNLPLIEDIWKGKGPLAGIHAGLSHSTNEKNIIVACDMPFISKKLAGILLKEIEQFQAAVPDIFGQMHPLFAAYQKGVTDEVERCMKEEQLRIRSVLQRVNTKILAETELKEHGYVANHSNLFNMNDPHDYKEAVQMEKGNFIESRELR